MGNNKSAIPNKRHLGFHFYDQRYHTPKYLGQYNDRIYTVESNIGDRSGTVFSGRAIEGNGTTVIDVSSFVTGTLTVFIDWRRNSDTNIEPSSRVFTDYLDAQSRFSLPTTGVIQLTTEVNDTAKTITIPNLERYFGIHIFDGGVREAYYTCEENDGTTLYDALGGNNNATITNIHAGFWASEPEVPFSFINNVGYNLSTNTYIPANLTTLITDATGTSLTNLGRVKQTLTHVNASCLSVDGTISLTLDADLAFNYNFADNAERLTFTCYAQIDNTSSLGTLIGTVDNSNFALRLSRTEFSVGAITGSSSLATTLSANTIYLIRLELTGASYELFIDDVSQGTGTIALSSVESLRAFCHVNNSNKLEGKIFDINITNNGSHVRLPLSEGSGLNIESLVTTGNIENMIRGIIDNPGSINVWDVQHQSDYNGVEGCSRALAIDFENEIIDQFPGRDFSSNPVLAVSEGLSSYSASLSRYSWVTIFPNFRIGIIHSGDAVAEYVPPGGVPSGVREDVDGIFYTFNQEANQAPVSLTISQGLFTAGLQNARFTLKLRVDQNVILSARDNRASSATNSLIASYRGDPVHDPAGVLPTSGTILTDDVNAWYNNASTPQASKDPLDTIIQNSFSQDWQPFYNALIDTSGQSITRNLGFHADFLIPGSGSIETLSENQFTHSSTNTTEFNRTSAQDGLALGVINDIRILTENQNNDITIQLYMTGSFIEDAVGFRPSFDPDFLGTNITRQKSQSDSNIRFTDSPMMRFFGLVGTDYTLDTLEDYINTNSRIFADNRVYLKNILGYFTVPTGINTLIDNYVRN